MVICAEAGLSLDATLLRVAEEMQKTDPALSDEFSLTGLELGFLPERRTAMQNLAKRTDLTVLRGMVGTLLDRKNVVSGKSVSVRVVLGGRSLIKKTKKKKKQKRK